MCRSLCTSAPAEFSGDARVNLDRLPGPAPVMLGDVEWVRAAAIVDGLLGTGFEGEPRGAIAVAIDEINRTGAAVVSIDVPSGVDASTGVVNGSAVRAALTATFHAAKPGLWIRPGKEHAGEVELIDIGIPRGAPIDIPPAGPAGADLPRAGG